MRLWGKTIKCEPTLLDLARTDLNRQDEFYGRDEFYRRRHEGLILAAGAVLGVIILGIGLSAFF
jgi:hypothetical protein